ncbi:hypothetical protein BDR06DRAFT_977963 [Suillus hirtellus]|nr:hypothetical protein BDR06DRAFT_977963 [Suillus hirtellus]
MTMEMEALEQHSKKPREKKIDNPVGYASREEEEATRQKLKSLYACFTLIDSNNYDLYLQTNDFLDDERPSLLWTKQDFNNAKRNSRGILQAQASDHTDAGTLSYIVDEFGTVASANVQKSMRDYQRTVWKTLRTHGYAAPSWKCTDKMGKEFYYRCMREKFPQFRLCNNDWKAEAFAVHYYSQWSERPKDNRDPQTKFKLEKTDATSNLKLEPAMLPAAEPGIKSSKRPSSLTAVTSDRIKKTESSPPSESNIQGPRRTVDIARRVHWRRHFPTQLVIPSNEHDTLQEHVTEPLQSNELGDVILGHGCHDIPQDATDSDIILLDPISVQPALCAFPISMLEPSTTTASTNEPTILHRLASSLNATRSMPSSVTTPTTMVLPADDSLGNSNDSLVASRRKKDSSRESIFRHSRSSTTARNLCGIDYVSNKGHAVSPGQFTDYWNSLVLEEREVWERRSIQAKIVHDQKASSAEAIST